MDNLFTRPHRLPLVAPSVLSADFANLADDCRTVLGDGPAGSTDDPTRADLLHIDVMDGHFVPNLTMGPAIVKSLRAALPEVFLDVHVMVTDPQQYVEPFAGAGANHLTFHIEPAINRRAGTGLSPYSQGYNVRDVAKMCRDNGMTAGIALNPPTPADAILDHLGAFDLVLVMSVHPGFSGQAFISDVLKKTEVISPLLGPRQRLEMDGGIGPENAQIVREAGCDVIVAASAIFGQDRGNRGEVIRRLRNSGN